MREEGAGKSYEQELREQMEYKRALEDERRRREREDEERMERRTRDRVHAKFRDISFRKINFCTK
jgi:hypothetical protein